MLGIELTPEHPVDRVGELANRAEVVGFDTVFASHHYNNRDAFLALSEVARRTDSLRLGPGVTNPYETHPVSLAARVATLDELADGRAIFGIGAGDRSTLANLGVDREKPLERVLETLQISRQLWEGERVDHDGTFRAEAAGLNFSVDRIPVYVGAQGPDMLRMAGKHADGVLINGAHPADVEWAVDRLAEGQTDRGQDRGDLDRAVYASTSLAREADAARQAARPPVAFIASGAPEAVLERHELDLDRAATIRTAIGTGDFTAAFDRVSESMLDAFAITGTPEMVAEQVGTLLGLADSVVLAAPLGPDLETAIELAETICQRYSA